ncbi:MAG TPA: DNA adenine methylase [Solirubrobacterales bacterium]|nr:DNA adenine methylase [Solirubrobacterales bacterium]
MTLNPTAAPVSLPSPGPAEPAFRPIQYMGSKARMLDFIRRTVDGVDPSRGRTVDLFSGSGVVAAELGRRRPVVAVDVQEYARVLASALLSPTHLGGGEIEALAASTRERAEVEWLEPLLEYEREAGEAADAGEPEQLCEIVENGSMAALELGEGPAEGALEELLSASSGRAKEERLTLTRHYGGVFFGYAQALLLDCLVAVVREGPASARDTGLAAILGAASECVTSVGSHFAQPLRPRDRQQRPKQTALRAAAQRRRRDPISVFTGLLQRYAKLTASPFEGEAVQSDYRAFLANEEGPVAAIYADPPYTRDHYSRFYHVLETIARGDEPSVSTVTLGSRTLLSRGLYRVERHQSPFCIRSQAPAAFTELFAGARELEAPLVLSYSPYSSGTAARPEPRLLTIEALIELASPHFGEVGVESAGRFSHSRFNSSHLNGEIETEAETLLICLP